MIDFSEILRRGMGMVSSEILICFPKKFGGHTAAVVFIHPSLCYYLLNFSSEIDVVTVVDNKCSLRQGFAIRPIKVSQGNFEKFKVT